MICPPLMHSSINSSLVKEPFIILILLSTHLRFPSSYPILESILSIDIFYCYIVRLRSGSNDIPDKVHTRVGCNNGLRESFILSIHLNCICSSRSSCIKCTPLPCIRVTHNLDILLLLFPQPQHICSIFYTLLN